MTRGEQLMRELGYDLQRGFVARIAAAIDATLAERAEIKVTEKMVAKAVAAYDLRLVPEAAMRSALTAALAAREKDG